MVRMPFRLLSFDLDGTLLGRPESTERFQRAWNAVPLGIRPLLVYNTSRSVDDTRTLLAAGRLPEPDYIVGSMGTDLYSSLYLISAGFRARLRNSWNCGQIEEIVGRLPGIRRQPAEFANEFKSSWYWEDAPQQHVVELTAKLQLLGLQAMIVYSCRRFLDVIPALAGKGNALAWICQRLGIAMNQVIVAGDTANDRSMFELEDVRGILVGNALPELRAACDPQRTFAADAEMADGVLEGMRHFGLLPAEPIGN
ncbi:MAG TPA: HAD-IIB family hydrolase [Candidatus Didemnitutus sp.]|nr:HAD-IIB family hydrolase [Candidatus Didemnitutus sp.]